MVTIQINNNASLGDLHDGMTWIRGDRAEGIQLTIFLFSIGGHQLRHCLAAINGLLPGPPVLVSVVMNVSPTSRAYAEMTARCTTPFFVQLDEDMELLPGALTRFQEEIEEHGQEVRVGHDRPEIRRFPALGKPTRYAGARQGLSPDQVVENRLEIVEVRHLAQEFPVQVHRNSHRASGGLVVRRLPASSRFLHEPLSTGGEQPQDHVRPFLQQRMCRVSGHGVGRGQRRRARGGL